MNKLPAFLHQTKTLLIDDDYGFIKRLSKCFPFKDYCILVSEPEKIIDKLGSKILYSPLENKAEAFVPKCITDVATIRTHKSRENQISVIASDYTMEPYDGIQVCSAVKSPYVQKIMMTSYGTFDLAIEGRRNGIIDRFASKVEDNWIEIIEREISEATIDYFVSLSEEISGYKEEGNPLFDPVFIKYFDNFVEKYNIVEYYTVCFWGNFIMFNDKGQRRDLVLKSRADIRDGFIDSYYADLASPEIINKIKKFEEIPCHQNADGRPLAVDEWEKHMVPIDYIGGSQQYFVATAEQIFQSP